VVWTDAETGIECKGRIDYLRGGCLVDLKGTRDIDARVFGATAARFGYVGQLAFYTAGLEANGVVLDEPPRIVAVESEPPHDVAVFEVGPDLLTQARYENAGLLSIVSAGRTSKLWPGRYPEAVPLVLPAWASPVDDSDDVMNGLIIGGAA
jgi:hypothetical protein